MGTRHTSALVPRLLSAAIVALITVGTWAVVTWEPADELTVSSGTASIRDQRTLATTAPPRTTTSDSESTTTSTTAPVTTTEPTAPTTAPATTSTLPPPTTAPAATPAPAPSRAASTDTSVCGPVDVGSPQRLQLSAFFPQCPDYSFDANAPDPAFCGRLATVHHYGYLDASTFLAACPYGGPIPEPGYGHHQCYEGTVAYGTDPEYDPDDPCSTFCPDWTGYIVYAEIINPCERVPS